VRYASLQRNVGKSAVAIVLEQMRDGFLSRRKPFEAGAVHQEDIEPAIVVVVVERDTAAGCFEKIFVLVRAAKNCLDVKARLLGHVEEADAEIGVGLGRWFLLGLLKRSQPRRTR
jgi:hypothetical protein